MPFADKKSPAIGGQASGFFFQYNNITGSICKTMKRFRFSHVFKEKNPPGMVGCVLLCIDKTLIP
mgnify:CR=1 FL=1